MDTGARSVMGISQFMVGNYPGCMETLQAVIGAPNLASQAEYVYAESMIRTGQTGLGMERLQALERSNPEIPDVHRSLGEALGIQGEKQKALEEFRIAIQLSPSDPDAHYDLGTIELESGDTAAAVPQLETAVRLSPDQEKFHRELADAYTAALRPADAQKELETCNLLRAHAQTSTLSHQGTASAQ
jgi:Flp pilus assembly protein TadD